ncbi:MAG: helix-turn-helix transcriptional regulator [Clostridia bacterium]|nr:helix-turn-helix transcriptional regulator [Clostridia bacterium]MBQ2737817.1 helix-turn-helix transcriptional regulator [Clostridia bacterium]MBQ8290494.1 helix-turn-helix transcriptional regulator [Clostridia bacterium]
MENIKEIIAYNLAALRKERKFTQQELASRLNYSDKAVSRWEHAETLPDIETLCKICEIYGVKFEYLLQKEQPKKNNPNIIKKDTPNKIIIMLIAALSVWIAAIVAYSYMNIILMQNAWTIFIWAIPLTCSVLQISNSYFFKNVLFKYILSSVINWTMILSIYLQLISYNIWMLFIIGIPIQIIIVLLAILKISKNNS